MAYQQVQQQFTLAQNYAATATTRAEDFVKALNSAVAGLAPPTITDTLSAPNSPTFTTIVPSLSAASISLDPVAAPDALESAPNVTVTDFSAPSSPLLVMPSFTPGSVTKPTDPDALVVPDLPDPLTLAPVALPEFLDIRAVAFGGVNDHGDWLDKLKDIPSLSIVEPTAYSYAPSPAYQSALLTEMTQLIRTRLSTSTGLPADVEQAIWDRARSREAGTAQATIDEVMRNAEARGFALPSGTLAAQLRDAQRNFHAKQSELSRDIAVKQAELEQENAKHAIEQGLQLEGRLIEYANNMEQRAFESARFAAQNAVEIYNALVAKYRTVLEGYNTYAGIYRTLIESERAKIEVYRAELEAETQKIQINESKVQLYRAEIEGRSSQVELYKAELGAVQTLTELEKLKIEAFGERVKAYVAELNGEATKVEIYKAQLQGNALLVDSYKGQVEAYGKKVEAEATKARTTVELYDSKVRAYTGRVQAYAAQVQAASEKVRAAVSVREQDLGFAKLQVDAAESDKRTAIEKWRADISLYESAKSIVLQKGKVLSDQYMAVKSMVADASKVSAQVNAQLAASAYGTIQAHANIQGSDSVSTSFNYSGETSDSRGAPTYVP